MADSTEMASSDDVSAFGYRASPSSAMHTVSTLFSDRVLADPLLDRETAIQKATARGTLRVYYATYATFSTLAIRSSCSALLSAPMVNASSTPKDSAYLMASS